MKIVNSAYMSQGQAVPTKMYHPPKNNYVLMYLFSINTHTFTYQALPKAISCKQYYLWVMANDVLLFFVFKEDMAAVSDLHFLGSRLLNINWGLELLEHTRYAAYHSVGIPHPRGVLATTPKAMETTYEIHVRSKPCIIQHSQAIYHSCCFSSTHRMAPQHPYASFLSIPNHDHHLPNINRCNTVTVHLQNDAPATRCDPSLYYKKKGKIMTLPGAPTKT